ncbi:hypothetical protein R6Q57_026348 [Mikania cordata]
MVTICLFIVFILLGPEVHSAPSNYSLNIHHDLRFIDQTVTNTGRSDGCDRRADHWVEVISWEPRAVIYHNFLSEEECEHVINISIPHMKKSTIMDYKMGEIEDTKFRTSYITFLDRGQDETIRAMERRIADFTLLPVEHGEDLQVLHYEVGQKFETHNDYFFGDYSTRNGGQRMATFVMYL